MVLAYPGCPGKEATTTTTVLWPFFRDHPGEPVAKRTSGFYGAWEE